MAGSGIVDYADGIIRIYTYYNLVVVWWWWVESLRLPSSLFSAHKPTTSTTTLLGRLMIREMHLLPLSHPFRNLSSSYECVTTFVQTTSRGHIFSMNYCVSICKCSYRHSSKMNSFFIRFLGVYFPSCWMMNWIISTWKDWISFNQYGFWEFVNYLNCLSIFKTLHYIGYQTIY